jgi:hypothetical protein
MITPIPDATAWPSIADKPTATLPNSFEGLGLAQAARFVSRSSFNSTLGL